MIIPQTFDKNTSIFFYLKTKKTAGFHLCYFLDRRNCAARAHRSISSILNPFLYLGSTWSKPENSTLVGTSEGEKKSQNNVWSLLHPTSLRTQHWVTDTLERSNLTAVLFIISITSSFATSGTFSTWYESGVLIKENSSFDTKLTLALDGGEGSASRPGDFTPGGK
jgi:hypothetical protein